MFVVQREIRQYFVCVSTPVSIVEQFHVNTFKQSKPTTPKQSQLLDLLAKQEIQLQLRSMHNTAKMTLSKPGSQVSLCRELMHTSISKVTICCFDCHVGLNTSANSYKQKLHRVCFYKCEAELLR